MASVTEIGTRIRAVRAAKELSQEKFAELVGSTRVSITRYEDGSRCPDAVTVAAICSATGVSADYLLGLIDQTNHNAADVNAVTGLSELAIERLRQLKTLQFASVINTILESISVTDDKARSDTAINK